MIEIGLVVAAHGSVADALVDAALQVVPDPEAIATVSSFDPQESAAYVERLNAAVAQARRPRGVLILADMVGGTPAKTGLILHEPGSIEVVTGLSLPMLIRALHLRRRDISVEVLAREVKTYAERAITVATDVLSKRTPS